MKTKLIKTFLIGILLQPVLGLAQVSPNVNKLFPAHIIYKIDEVNSKVNLSEDTQIKLGRKLYAADSLANVSIVKGEPIAQLKSYYTVDAGFLKPIFSPEELDTYGYATDHDNRYLAALNFAPQLKLESTQINEIRKQNDSLAGVPKISLKETIRIYNKKLHSILAKEQYVSLLKIIYQEQSEDEAKSDWEKIIKLQLVADKNDRTEYIKIINYHLAKNVFLDKKADRYEKTKRDLLAKKMALEEPLILLHVNILSEGSYTNNKYSSVIKYEKEVELTKSQIDTILVKYKELERIKLENKEKESSSDAPKIVPSEYGNIALILNSEQVKKWLINKNIKIAKKEAQRNWEQLEAEGLSTDLDKDKTLREFGTYQLKYLVTKERAMIYHTQENIFMKRDVEQKKPELLKQLDAIARKKSKNTTTKNALTW
ncbi:hypothetical protein [Flavobacterium piscis]|uniref:Uncharacterized protein n=1 Tax=Flavobacterium piscis TaxID=1114874 RepID=A0ABU1YE05_9FLAO|nr:hypothetical protein [Flavobacterium piscis]MDR7211870.1 hypothetical protein [Flavobacterium piscis]